MISEHTKMIASMKPYADAWGLTPATGPDADHQKEIDKLNGLSGEDFDKEYIDQMVTDHAKALGAFTKEAKDTKDTKFQAGVLGQDRRRRAQEHGVRPEEEALSATVRKRINTECPSRSWIGAFADQVTIIAMRLLPALKRA